MEEESKRSQSNRVPVDCWISFQWEASSWPVG